MKPPVTLKSVGCQIPCAIVNLLPTWKAVPQSDPQPPLEQKKQVLRPTQNSAKKTNESQQNKAPIIYGTWLRCSKATPQGDQACGQPTAQAVRAQA